LAGRRINKVKGWKVKTGGNRGIAQGSVGLGKKHKFWV
jgi:hypothetical protein